MTVSDVKESMKNSGRHVSMDAPLVEGEEELKAYQTRNEIEKRIKELRKQMEDVVATIKECCESKKIPLPTLMNGSMVFGKEKAKQVMKFGILQQLIQQTIHFFIPIRLPGQNWDQSKALVC